MRTKPSQPYLNTGISLGQGVKGAWLFAEQALGSIMMDYSGYGKHGINTDTGVITSEIGPVSSYDGLSSRVAVLDDPLHQSPSEMTWMLLFRSKAFLNDDGGLLTKGDSFFGSNAAKVYEIGILNDILYWQVSDGTDGDQNSVSVAGLDDGEWHQVVATWKVGEMTLLIDGTTVGTPVLAPVASCQDTGKILYFGGGNSSFQFDGELGAIFFWDRVLTESEKLDLWDDPFKPFRI